MKGKFLTTLALFASLALTACGGTPAESQEAKWESDKNSHWHLNAEGEKVDKASHEFEEDPAQAVAPTCSAEGKKVEICKVCGYVKESKVNKTDHTWGEWVEKAGYYCGPSEKEHECSVCHTIETEVCGIKQHTWEVTGSVEAGDGGLAYNLVKCSVCQRTGLMLAVKNADGTNNMTVTGTPKTAPEGCVKLGAADDYIMGAIKLDAAKTGRIFMRGSMDYWYTESNQNEQKGIYDGKGVADKASGVANFKMEVGPDAEHLSQVALTADKDLLYKDFLPAEVGFTGVSSTDWSTIGDIEIGNVSLAAGLNTIKFTRVDSYNIAVHDFVMVFDA